MLYNQGVETKGDCLLIVEERELSKQRKANIKGAEVNLNEAKTVKSVHGLLVGPRIATVPANSRYPLFKSGASPAIRGLCTSFSASLIA